MNPITEFEKSAQSIWKSDLSQIEKASRLHRVRQAIVQYVSRLDEQRPKLESDAWGARSFDRIRGYLVHLAADVENLSLECEKLPPPPYVKAKESPYVS